MCVWTADPNGSAYASTLNGYVYLLLLVCYKRYDL